MTAHMWLQPLHARPSSQRPRCSLITWSVSYADRSQRLEEVADRARVVVVLEKNANGIEGRVFYRDYTGLLGTTLTYLGDVAMCACGTLTSAQNLVGVSPSDHCCNEVPLPSIVDEVDLAHPRQWRSSPFTSSTRPNVVQRPQRVTHSVQDLPPCPSSMMYILSRSSARATPIRRNAFDA
jgi:hypothetical protein